jgi:hypothetical protein
MFRLLKESAASSEAGGRYWTTCGLHGGARNRSLPGSPGRLLGGFARRFQRHARPVPGIQATRRRVDIRTSTRFSAPAGSYRLELAMHVPTWMAGTRPAMT